MGWFETNCTSVMLILTDIDLSKVVMNNTIQKATADENDSSTTSASAPDSLADDEVG